MRHNTTLNKYAKIGTVPCKKFWLIGFTAVALLFAQSALACGERVNLETHDDTRSAYSLAGSKDAARAVLVIAHTGDKCVRTPPDLAGLIVEKTLGTREKTVKVSGGPGW